MVQLRRKLGFWQAYATATGLVVAGSTMVSLAYSMGLVGPAFLIPSLIAMVISIMIALSYAELASFMPGAGMVGDYTMVAMGKFMAIIAVLGAYFVLAATVGAAETTTASLAVQSLFPNMNTTLFAIVLLTFFLIINLIGVEVFGAIQLVLTLGMMITTAVMGFFGLMDWFTVKQPHAVEFNPSGWSTVFQSIGLAIWLFIGIEYAVPMIEEVKKPQKTIPKAMVIGLLSIFAADMLFGEAIIHYMDLSKLQQSATPQVDGANAMFGHSGAVLITIVTILASASSINSNFAAIPRLFYGLARDGMMPKIFAYLHPKFRTPWAGIILLYTLFCLPLFILKIEMSTIAILILSASVTWLISYIIAQVDLIILRRRYPDHRRPFKAPLFPAMQWIGILACVYMIFTIHPDTAMKLRIYLISGGFLLVICLYAGFWLKSKNEPLFNPIPLEDKMQILPNTDEDEEAILHLEVK
ncbi:APC family permease [Heyndrickxia coagulans]|uniref:APC family permease n=1 Tax=Heyndrickxia coagulans TaxID=1398 RepID=UPI000E528F8B|nr:APC family permease [Heyndrickxia coagulans]RGR84988.1 APC family permease [Heyndrickxia coagulans]RGR98216.1 APC family permease [Heyndrickxia coagulans]